jgi:hypothetical protein
LANLVFLATYHLGQPQPCPPPNLLCLCVTEKFHVIWSGFLLVIYQISFLFLFHLYFSERGWDHDVGIIIKLQAERPRSRSSIPCRRKVFFFFKLVWTRSGAKLLSYLLVTWTDFPVRKNMGHKFNNTYPYIADAKNKIFYTSILP